jgi:hypothetical protein
MRHAERRVPADRRRYQLLAQLQYACVGWPSTRAADATGTTDAANEPPGVWRTPPRPGREAAKTHVDLFLTPCKIMPFGDALWGHSPEPGRV